MRITGTNNISSLLIADFGVAKIFEASSLNQAYTKTGTIGYMAPEIANSIDHKYDSFAVDGKVFF